MLLIAPIKSKGIFVLWSVGDTVFSSKFSEVPKHVSYTREYKHAAMNSAEELFYLQYYMLCVAENDSDDIIIGPPYMTHALEELTRDI